MARSDGLLVVAAGCLVAAAGLLWGGTAVACVLGAVGLVALVLAFVHIRTAGPVLPMEDRDG